MHKFLVLFRTMVRYYFGLSILQERLRRRQEIWKPALALLGALAIGVPLLYGYTRLLITVYQTSAQLSQPGIIVLFGLLTVQLVVLLFGFFYLISVFYYSSDMEYLVPMPLSPEVILTAKFGIVLLTEYVTALPLTIPPLVVYGMQQSVGLGFWLAAAVVVALLPMLPLALAAILAVLLMRTTSLAKHRDALRVFAGLIAIAVGLVFQWYVSRMGMQDTDPNQIVAGLLAAPNSLIQIMGKRFPPSLWGAMALVSHGAAAIRYMLAYVGSTIVAFGLFWVVARRFFYTGLLQSATHPQASRRRQRDVAIALRARPPFWALVHREWVMLVRNPIFAMTTGMNIFVPPLVLVLPSLGAGNQLFDIQILQANPRFYLWGALIVAGLFGAMAPLVSIAPTAVSREGRLFWHSQTIPISPVIQLGAKLLFSVIAGTLAACLILLVAVMLLHLPINSLLLGILLGLLALSVTSACSLAMDVFWPRLNWENPQQAMKGNQNVLISMAMVAGLEYGLVRLVIWAVHRGWSDFQLVAVLTVVLLALLLGAIRMLIVLGNALYLPKAAVGRKLSQHATPTAAELIRRHGRSVVHALVVVVLVLFIGHQFQAARNMKYTFGSDAVSFSSVTLQYHDITEVQYLQEVPPLSGRVGTGIGNLQIGTFTVSGIGRGKVYATDISKPALFIRTDKTFYIITPDNAKEHYEQIRSKIAK